MHIIRLLIVNTVLFTMQLAPLVAWVAMVDQGGAAEPALDSLSQRVAPLIGTGANPYVCGNNSPAATLPFGLVRLSPDTVSDEGTAARPLVARAQRTAARGNTTFPLENGFFGQGENGPAKDSGIRGHSGHSMIADDLDCGNVPQYEN